MTSDARRSAGCKCGKVELEVSGRPIVTTVCHCSSCEKAGQLLERLPGATPVLTAAGGTPLVLFRKDRALCVRGEALLAEHRLSPSSPTRRVVARCCNTAMFLDSTKGHWISIYNERLPLDANGADRNSGFVVLRLLWAWAEMGLRTPTIGYVRGRIDDLVI
jgi:hypothetical protein